MGLLSYNFVRKTILYLSSFLSISCLLYFFFFAMDSDLVQTKKELTMLQHLEFEYRDSKFTDIKFINNEVGEFFCIKGINGNRIWVLANPKSSPYYKQMPVADYSVSKIEFSHIKNEVNLSETVQLVLKSHIEE